PQEQPWLRLGAPECRALHASRGQVARASASALREKQERQRDATGSDSPLSSSIKAAHRSQNAGPHSTGAFSKVGTASREPQQATISWNGRSAGAPLASNVWTSTAPETCVTVTRPGTTALPSVLPSVAV